MSDETDKLLNQVADGIAPLPRFSRSKDGITRSEVVNAFHTAFQMIGGVQRLAIWGNENPTEFMRLYAKLLPATTVVLGEGARTIIEHTLAPTALDRHPTDAPRLLTNEVEDAVYVHADS